MAIPRKKFSVEVAGKELVLEVSSIAEQANSAVIAHYGETSVLVTTVMSKSEVTLDYLPLKVDYEERFYASGKIIGSRFVRREARPSEEAILAGRLVDRVIRPLFDQRLRREIQVVVTILALEEEHTPDFVALMAASTALGISDIPWAGPVAGVRVSKSNGEFALNPPDYAFKKEYFTIGAFVAGPKGRINMIEFYGKESREEHVLTAIKMAQAEIDRLVEFQEKIIAEIGKPKAAVVLYEPDPELRKTVEEFITPRLDKTVYQPNKMEHERLLYELKHDLFAQLKEKFETPDLKAADFLVEEIIDALVHKNILESGRRPDGRKLDEVRALNAETGLFRRTHGSALFVRGNTQALAVTTLAPPGSEQLVETMETTTKRRFMLHYNFPPYSVGETGAFRGPGRREIGHGALAGKALLSLIPSQEEFPYTIRVVSEILSSNGSSSMATVCAASLSLMDAGVPIKKPAAGIAMGLMMTDVNNYKVITDLQGPEDHYGDMDFKVAGTRDGINAIQLDVKIQGVSLEIIERTLAQAQKARLEILDFMQTVLPELVEPAISK